MESFLIILLCTVTDGNRNFCHPLPVFGRVAVPGVAGGDVWGELWWLLVPGGCDREGTMISGIGKRKKLSLSMGQEPALVQCPCAGHGVGMRCSLWSLPTQTIPGFRDPTTNSPFLSSLSPNSFLPNLSSSPG